MRYSHIYKQFTTAIACCFLVGITAVSIADNAISQYPQPIVGNNSNPSAWSQMQGSNSGFQQIPSPWGGNVQNTQSQQPDQNNRFVTPEILESIKKQQSENQVMPENKPSSKPALESKSEQSYRNYSNPLSGTDYTDPLYGSTNAYPWGMNPYPYYGNNLYPIMPTGPYGGYSPYYVMPYNFMPMGR